MSFLQPTPSIKSLERKARVCGGSFWLLLLPPWRCALSIPSLCPLVTESGMCSPGTFSSPPRLTTTTTRRGGGRSKQMVVCLVSRIKSSLNSTIAASFVNLVRPFSFVWEPFKTAAGKVEGGVFLKGCSVPLRSKL